MMGKTLGPCEIIESIGSGGMREVYKAKDRQPGIIRLFAGVILLLCGFASPVFAQRSTIFPEFFTGNGWICELFFSNQGIITVSGIDIAFYDKYGNPVSVDSNLGTDTSYTFNLGPGSTQIIQINPETAYVEGYAVITYPSSSAPIRATLVFRYEDVNGNVTAEAGVPQQEYGYHYSFPAEMDSSRNISTAFAIVNPQIYVSTDQVMLISLIGTDGGLQQIARKPLGPGEHFAGYLDQLFPGLDNFIGSVSITSPFGAGVLALRQDKNAFGAISTDYGPVLGPLALDSLAIGEVEPNNNSTQAQFIAGTGKISGAIGVQGDVDTFAYSGQAGDVVSVICNAQAGGSWLDSVLEIRNSNLDFIAEKNQNGLASELNPMRDSFTQVELPASDTYFISVKDFGGNGGPEYFYTLHVNVRGGASTTYAIGGTVAGMAGSGLTLQNGAESIAIHQNGQFTFPTTVHSGSSYKIEIQSQPSGPAQNCAVTVETMQGIVRGLDINDISVVCRPKNPPPFMDFCTDPTCGGRSPTVVRACPETQPNCSPSRSTEIVASVDGQQISGMLLVIDMPFDYDLTVDSGNGTTSFHIIRAPESPKVVLASDADVHISYYNVAPVWGGTTQLEFGSLLTVSNELDSLFFWHTSFDTGSAAMDLHMDASASIIDESAITGLTAGYPIQASFIPTELIAWGEGDFYLGTGKISVNYGNPPYLARLGSFQAAATPRFAHEYAHALFERITPQYAGNSSCLAEGFADALAFVAGYLPEDDLGPKGVKGLNFETDGCPAQSGMHDIGNCPLWHVKNGGLLTPGFIYGLFHPQRAFSFDSCSLSDIETGNSLFVLYTEASGGADVGPVLDAAGIPHADTYQEALTALGF